MFVSVLLSSNHLPDPLNRPPPPPPPPVYLLKNHNFGAMDAWNYTVLPKEVDEIKSYAVNPENDGILYGVTPSCIARSKDRGETWYDPCWKAAGLTAAPGSTFTDLVIKDSKTMLVLRSGDVALRTQDGGKSWSALTSMAAIANASHMADYSWTGKTLVLHGADQHAPYNDFDIILDHFSRTAQLHPTPHAPCAMIYLVPILIGC